jgi:hypothetical protein
MPPSAMVSRTLASDLESVYAGLMCAGLPGAQPGVEVPMEADGVDLLGIVSASQALSSETSVDRLHARMVEVLSAMTGATGVQLLLWSEDRHGWLLPVPDADGGTVPVSRTGQDRAVPTSVLRYLQRTREPLVVADAVRDDRFARRSPRRFPGMCAASSCETFRR